MLGEPAEGDSASTWVASVVQGLPGLPGVAWSSLEALYTTAITAEDVARQLKISRSQVFDLMAKGKLRSFRIGRSRRVWLVDLVDFIRRRLEEEAEL